VPKDGVLELRLISFNAIESSESCRSHDTEEKSLPFLDAIAIYIQSHTHASNPTSLGGIQSSILVSFTISSPALQCPVLYESCFLFMASAVSFLLNASLDAAPPERVEPVSPAAMRWVMAEKERMVLGVVVRGIARVAMRKDIVVCVGGWMVLE
jgi:hypothetical protein